jgi:hypothetical protein
MLNNYIVKVLNPIIIKALKLYLNLVKSLFTNNIRPSTSKLSRATI